MGKQILTILAVLSLVVAGVVIVTTTCDNNTGTDAATKIVYVDSESSDADRAKAYIATEADNYINPDDVERMEALRDASATAIYGDEEGNGVILITVSKEKVKAMDETAKRNLIAAVNGVVGYTFPVLYVVDAVDASYLPAADNTVICKDEAAAAAMGPVIGTTDYKGTLIGTTDYYRGRIVSVADSGLVYTADNTGLVIPELDGKLVGHQGPADHGDIRVRGIGSLTGPALPLIVIPFGDIPVTY